MFLARGVGDVAVGGRAGGDVVGRGAADRGARAARNLAALDELLCDPALLAPFVEHLEREARLSGTSAADHGRPTLAIETYVRLMVLKHRHGYGYRTLVAEVSDSIHLRRFCRIALTERVPDESTIRKLTRRIGEQTVNDITRELIEAAVRERRFRARAIRIDSTVIEADIKYPTDAGLASHGVRSLAREGRKLAAKLRDPTTRVRDRSRSMGHKLRAISRTIRRRSGHAKAEVLALTEQTGELLAQSVKEARRLAATARRKARGRGAQAKLRAAAKLDELADRCEKVATQIDQRVARREDHRPPHLPVRSRRQADPQGQARQAQRVRVRRADRRDHPEHQARRTRTDRAGRLAARQPGENALLPQTVTELRRGLACRPRRSRWTAASPLARRPSNSKTSIPNASSSPDASNPAPDAPNEGCSATAPAPKDASATSNAATACAAAASKAMTARRPGPDGASWPTTSTP